MKLQVLIAGDEPKRGAKDLWGYVNDYTNCMYNHLCNPTSS